jgi:AcrR family transcriptional regulator
MSDTPQKAPEKKAGRLVRLPKAHRVEQLLNVALELFIAHGYQGTSMEDIASAAGVTRPIVYNHFGSKDGIYLACLRRARADLDRQLAHAGNYSRLEDRLSAGVNGYFNFVEQNRLSWQLLFAGGVAVAGPAAEEAARLRFSTVEGIAQLFAGVTRSSDRTELLAYAHALSGAGEQLAKWWLTRPDLRREQVVAVMVQLMWQGLRPLATEQ